MKKILFAVLAVCFAATLAYAQDQSTVSSGASQIVTLSGIIIDNKCADANKDSLATFAATHPKSCALQCQASGFSLVASDGTRYKFNEQSNAKIVQFLSVDQNQTKVVVKATKDGDMLSVVSIENQK